jgi:tetratricopeptide (TPR) repeat protein
VKRRFGLWMIALLCLAVPFASFAQTDVTCESLAQSGGNAAHYIGLGDAYRAQGDFTEAIIAFTCAIDLDPTYAPAYVSRGVAHVAQFNYPAALEDYNHALELDETYTVAYNNRGILYALQANFGLAIADFTIVSTFAPDDPTPYTNRALIHAAEHNFDLALADVGQALALDAEFAPAHATLGAIYLALAEESYATYADITENAPVPNGDAEGMLASLEAARDTGSSSAWMAFMITR